MKVVVKRLLLFSLFRRLGILGLFYAKYLPGSRLERVQRADVLLVQEQDPHPRVRSTPTYVAGPRGPTTDRGLPLTSSAPTSRIRKPRTCPSESVSLRNLSTDSCISTPFGAWPPSKRPRQRRPEQVPYRAPRTRSTAESLSPLPRPPRSE